MDKIEFTLFSLVFGSFVKPVLQEVVKEGNQSRKLFQTAPWLVLQAKNSIPTHNWLDIVNKNDHFQICGWSVD